MGTRSKILSGIIATAALSVSLSAMADSIHKALEDSQINKPVETRATGLKREFSPWSIQDHVERNRNAYKADKSVNSGSLAEMDEVSTATWRKVLGNPVKL